MAALIAQISLAARERKRRELEEPTVDIQRSVYKLPRFDSHFDPEKHNVWVRRYALAEEKREQSRIDEWKRIQDMRRRRSCAHLVPFSWKLCILESIIVGTMLAVVPVALIFVEIIFQEPT